MATVLPEFPGRNAEMMLALFGVVFGVAVVLISLDLMTDGALTGAAAPFLRAVPAGEAPRAA